MAKQQKNSSRAMSRKGVLTAADYNTRTVTPQKAPPTVAFNPIVRKTVRLVGSYAATSGSPAIISFSPNRVALKDANDYLSTTVRYPNVRLNGVRVWVINGQQSDPGIAATGSLAPNDLQVNSGSLIVEQFFLHDSPGPGIDWARVGFKPAIQDRAAWQSTANIANWFQVMVSADPGLPATTTIYGQFTVDIDAEFR